MIIKQNKAQSFGYFLVCLLVLAMFLFFAICDVRGLAHDESTLFDNVVFYWAFRVLVIALIPFIAFGAYYFLKSLFQKAPLIEMNNEAIIDNSSANSVGIIYWKDIKRAYIKGGYLLIETKNPEDYFCRKGTIGQFFMKLNKKMGYDYICISPLRFKKQAVEFLKAFNEKIEIEGIGQGFRNK